MSFFADAESESPCTREALAYVRTELFHDRLEVLRAYFKKRGRAWECDAGPYHWEGITEQEDNWADDIIFDANGGKMELPSAKVFFRKKDLCRVDTPKTRWSAKTQWAMALDKEKPEICRSHDKGVCKVVTNPQGGGFCVESKNVAQLPAGYSTRLYKHKSPTPHERIYRTCDCEDTHKKCAGYGLNPRNPGAQVANIRSDDGCSQDDFNLFGKDWAVKARGKQGGFTLSVGGFTERYAWLRIQG